MGSHRMTPNPTRPQGAREKFDLGTLGDVDEISAPGALFFGPWLQKVTSPQQILLVGSTSLGSRSAAKSWCSQIRTGQESKVCLRMETHTISDVQVEFPFTPYPCQLAYMEKVLQCLQKVQQFRKLPAPALCLQGKHSHDSAILLVW